MSLIFIKEALKNWKTQGSLLPSTSALSRRMLEPLKIRPGMTIVELGAGTGIITKQILLKLPEDCRLIVFENNRNLAKRLRQDLQTNIRRGRVVLIEDDAAKLPLHLKRLNIGPVHYIVSGLPIGNFDHAGRERLFHAIREGMRDDGVFIQFQYLLTSWLHVRRAFKARIIGLELRNLPPAFIYYCRKK